MREGDRDSYNFSGGVHGKHYQRYMESSNVVVLERMSIDGSGTPAL
jgi:hypothetical protein